jgi:hypothetical protein
MLGSCVATVNCSPGSIVGANTRFVDPIDENELSNLQELGHTSTEGFLARLGLTRTHSDRCRCCRSKDGTAVYTLAKTLCREIPQITTDSVLRRREFYRKYRSVHLAIPRQSSKDYLLSTC